MVWHVGLMSEEEAIRVAHLVDVISFDFVHDDQTIRQVFGLDYVAADYSRTYSMLRHIAPVVPHVTLGLYGGQIRGERDALCELESLGLDALVLLVFVPTRGTRYASCSAPSLDQVEAILHDARARFQDAPIYLGCMRPGGDYRRELDILAVDAGLDKIVNPTRDAVRTADNLGLRVRWEDECCVVHR
jgi:uncharacterized radical SAM superfamily protein